MHQSTTRPTFLKALVINPSMGVSSENLGIIIDDDFSWRPHIIGTCKTVSKNPYLLSQLKHFVDTPKRKLFYHAHISPNLTYV